MTVRTIFRAALLTGGLVLATVTVAMAADSAGIVFWQSIDRGKASELNAYVDTFPKGKFVKLAKVRLKELEQSAPAAPSAPPPPAAISGPVRVLNTGNLVVGNKTVALFGVIGQGAPYDVQLDRYIRDQGGAATCQPKDNGKWVCTTDAGFDVAQAALLNGQARAAPDAPPDYLEQQDQAKAKHVGIWQTVSSPSGGQGQGQRPNGGGHHRHGTAGGS